MSKSILDTRKGKCFLCGQYGMTEKHHIFGGEIRINIPVYASKENVESAFEAMKVIAERRKDAE